MSKQTRFQQTCPRKLAKYPNQPCPLALQSMEAIRNGEPEKVQCPFFVNSIESSFCFHKYMEEESPIEGLDSNRKIAQLLLISEKEVQSTLKSAVDKLQEESEDIQLFAEIIGEQTQYISDDIYATTSWFEEVTGKNPDDVPLESLEPGKPGRKKKVEQAPKGFTGGGAIHKSGRRIQLTNLSDNWHKHVKEFQQGDTPIRVSKNTLGKKKKDEEKDDKDN